VSNLEALLLGLVQGLTEFLPVSSSGHLVLLQALFGVAQEGILFEVVLHVATLGSVLVFYRKKVASLLVGAVRGDADAWRYGLKLGMATAPAVLAVLLAGDFLEAQYESATTAGLCLLITGGILWTTRTTLPRAKADEPTWAAAFLIGCAQAFAILPGISRSGSTVAAALALGIAPAAAAEFSFMMSIVAIVGAAVRMAPELTAVPAGQALPLALGGAVALVSGVAAIWLFVKLLRSQAFYHFAWYAWTAGALALFFLR
jgi:undecaprenyl-diphosphatase